MRAGMQDPIITLRNMLEGQLVDKNNVNVPVYTEFGEELLKIVSNKQVWVAIGLPAGFTPRETWLSLGGSGYRMYRSWRYPIYIGGWDLESMYKVKAKIMEIIRTQRTSHSAEPEYIEFMYVESVSTEELQRERTTPPFIMFVITVVMEFLEL